MASPGDIPALVRQLRSKNRVQQAAAASALREIACYGPDAALQEIVAAGGIAPLAQLLRESSSAAVLEHAASVLPMLAAGNSDEVAAEMGGMLPTLLRLLARRGSVAACTANLLAGLAGGSPELATAILAAGGLPALVSLLGSDKTEGERWMAAGALTNMSPHGPEFSAAVVAAGGLPPLIQMLGSHSALLQMAAAKALRNVAGYRAGAGAVAAAGAIPPLAHILRSDSSSVTLRSEAAWAIANLAEEADADTSAALVAAGVVAPIVALLSSIDEAAHVAAASALRNVCSNGGPSCAAAVAAGAAPALVARLRSPNDAVVQLAATALAHVAAFDEAAVLGAGAVEAAQQALARCQDSDVQQELSGLLKHFSPPPAEEAAPAESAAPAAPPPTLPAAPRVCAAPGCGATHGLRRCGGCGTVRYCSAACSRAHWRAHKAECRRLQAEQEQASGGGQP